MITSFTSERIYKDKELVSEINNSILECFDNENMMIVFEDEDYIIKGCIKDNFCYYIIMNDTEHHFIIDDLPLYVEGNDIEKLENSFVYGGIITFERVKSKIRSSVFSMSLLKDYNFLFNMDNKYIAINEQIHLKNENNLSFIDVYKMTNDLFFFQKMIDFLIEYSSMKEICLEKYISFSKDFSNIITDKKEDIFLKFNFLKDICKKYNHNSSKNSFEYNDMYNYVWLSNDVLILESQNLFLYLYGNDKNLIINFSIKDYVDNDADDYEEYGTSYYKEINEMVEKIKNNNFDIIKENCLLIENSVIIYSSESIYENLDLDLTYSIKAITEEYNEKVKQPRNLNTHEYFIKFFNKKYKYDKFRTLSHIFLTLGNGIDWKDGHFSYDEIYYIPDLDNIDFNYENKEYFLYGKFNDNIYNKIVYLNDDWFECLKVFYNFCLENKEKLTTYPTENIEDILNSMKEFLEHNITKGK